MPEQQHITLLLKLAVAASVASLLVRVVLFKRMLLREERTLVQRLKFALALATVFGAGVAVRVLAVGYKAVDLGLEGSILAGMLGGYVSGLVTGVLVSIPAMQNGEFLSMPLFAGVGVLGGLLRDLVQEPEEIWKFTPLPRFAWFNFLSLVTIVFAEFLRWVAREVFGNSAIFTFFPPSGSHPLQFIEVFVTTVFTVSLPLKIWNNSRNEDKLESQQRLLNEARLAALTRQINPHFLFNTLNSISSLIRTDPEKARAMIYKLSNILRRAMRKQEAIGRLRDEIAVVDDYMAIEMARFGSKLRYVKEMEPDTLDREVPTMLLQPLVENSIRHGLSSKIEGGMIRVRSRLVGNRLHIHVEDDGVGIPEARLSTLFEQGIGISNVNERLRVLFGQNYLLSVDSRAGQGTEVFIEIPELRDTLAAVS